MDLVDASMIFSGFLGVGVIVWSGLKSTGKRAVRLERAVAAFLHEWNGVPARDGEPARPGVMARLDAQDAALEAIRAQLQAQHGEGTTR